MYHATQILDEIMEESLIQNSVHLSLLYEVASSKLYDLASWL